MDWNFDKFWDFIENHYEEEWRVQANGSLILTGGQRDAGSCAAGKLRGSVDQDGTFRGGQTARRQEVPAPPPRIPDGEYIIKGVYDEYQRLVNGERTYFFIQGA